MQVQLFDDVFSCVVATLMVLYMFVNFTGVANVLKKQLCLSVGEHCQALL